MSRRDANGAEPDIIDGLIELDDTRRLTPMPSPATADELNYCAILLGPRYRAPASSLHRPGRPTVYSLPNFSIR